MPSFAVRHPYLIIVFCLFVCVLGITAVVQMPVDMFPPINMPVVLVATFYSGMPPQQIEADITDTFERFFTLASGVDHMESRSLTGVSLIKIYFQPGTDANADVTADLEPGHGRLAPPAGGDLATGGDKRGRLQHARLPAHRAGPGSERNATARPFAVSDPQSDRGRAGRDRASAFRRQVPPAHGLRGPAEVAGTSIEPHGRGARHGRLEPHPARRRRSHRPAGLQHLYQRAGAKRRGAQ